MQRYLSETKFVRNDIFQKRCLSETIFVYMSETTLCICENIVYVGISSDEYLPETISVRNVNCQKWYKSGTIFVRNDICQCLFAHVCDADVVCGKDVCDGETVYGDSLQRTATHCNRLQRTATHCNTLQHTATYCNTLQDTARHCKTLQRTARAQP